MAVLYRMPIFISQTSTMQRILATYFSTCLRLVIPVMFLVTSHALFGQSKKEFIAQKYKEIKTVIADDIRGLEFYNDILLTVKKHSKNTLNAKEEKALKNKIIEIKSIRIKGDRIKAIEEYNKLLEKYEYRCGPKILVTLYNELGLSYELASMDDLAFTHFLFAIEISKKYGVNGLEEAAFGLSMMYYQRQEFDKAVTTGRISLDIAQKYDSEDIHFYHNAIAMGLARMGETKESIQLFRKAYKHASNVNNLKAKAMYASNISAYFGRETVHLDSSYRYAQIACEIFDTGLRTYDAPQAYNNLAITMIQIGEPFDSAYVKAVIAEERALENRDWRNALLAVNTESYIEWKKENFEQVVEIMKKSLSYKDSLLKYQDYEASFRKDLNLNLQRKFQKIREDELMKKNEIERKNAAISFWLTSASIGGFFLLITVFFLVKNIRRQRRIRMLEIEKEQTRQKHDEEKLALKSREIASMTLLNANFQKTLDAIKDTLNKKEVSQAIQGEIEKEVVSLKNDINLTKNFNDRLEEFQANYNQTNPDFANNLKRLAPSLTNGEIRHCMLLKNNMSTDEIANLMGVEKTTLRTARHRIHKKLSLEKGVKLQDYLIAM